MQDFVHQQYDAPKGSERKVGAQKKAEHPVSKVTSD